MFHRMSNYGETEPRPTVVLTREMIKKSMPKYRRHEDLVVVQQSDWEEFKRALPIPVAKEENSPFSIDEDELASLVCQTIQRPPCGRLAVDKGVKFEDDNQSRCLPDVKLILGDNAIVTHRENNITYRLDITKCMFPFAGNMNEIVRMAEMDCSEEIVVDLFAGIGCYSLPLLVHSKSKHLYACEWNPDAIEAFKKNLTSNKVDPGRCTTIEGDIRSSRPTDVAQRVVMATLRLSCSDWMQTAFECIDKSTGATLHCHDLVETKPSQQSPPTLGEKQISCNSLETTSTGGADKLSLNNQSLLNQSLTSSSSSHSTIEKLSAPNLGDDKQSMLFLQQSSESDKDTNSPVLLEKPSELSGTTTTTTTNSSLDNGSDSVCSHTNNSSDTYLSVIASEESINQEPPVIDESQLAAFEARANLLISRINEDVEAHELVARLAHIQPVRTHALHVTHVVFDIKIEPKSRLNNSSSNNSTTSNNHHHYHNAEARHPAEPSHELNNTTNSTSP